MKQLVVDRRGTTPTLEEVPNEKIKIYDDKTSAEADLSNIEENEIIATKAGESEGVVEVVDTVEEDNPNAVSSGAVFDYAEPLPRPIDGFSSMTAIATMGSFTQIALEEGY